MQRQKSSGLELFNKFLKILYDEGVLEEEPTYPGTCGEENQYCKCKKEIENEDDD